MRRPAPLARRTLLLALLALGGPAIGVVHAHPISVSQENVFVTRDKVVITMQVFAEDLVFFHDLRPDDLDIVSFDDITAAIPKHATFLNERIRLIDGKGNLIPGKTTKIDDSEIEPPGYKVPELAFKKLAYTMEYELESPPQFLTFAQALVGGDAVTPSEVQLNVKQAGTPVEVSRMLLPASPYTMRFEWDDTLTSDEATDEERRAWFEKQREKTLGITNYDTAYSFLYVTDRGVRHEVLVPFVTLESFFIVDREKRAFLEVEEQPAAKEQIAEFFTTIHDVKVDGEFRKQTILPVEIDGVLVTPVVDRIEFFEVDFRDFAQRPDAARVATANARVGIILSYPAKNPPGHVKVKWDMWSRQLLEVRAVGFVYDERETPVFSKGERIDTWEWTAKEVHTIAPVSTVKAIVEPTPTLTLPIASLIAFVLAVPLLFLGLVREQGRRLLAVSIALCLVAFVAFPFARLTIDNPFVAMPDVDAERTHPIARTLLANTYRAFDYHAESDVYDALARSIDGPLLKETYLQINEGLRMQDQGGAISLVDEVIVKNGEKVALPDADRREHGPGFQYRCTWTVEGTVEHWGHVHSRTNQYVALFTIRAKDDVWRITDLEILDEERVGTKTGVRRF